MERTAPPPAGHCDRFGRLELVKDARDTADGVSSDVVLGLWCDLLHLPRTTAQRTPPWAEHAYQSVQAINQNFWQKL